MPLYWKCQLLGWSFASLFWNFNAFLDGGFHVGIAVVHFTLDLLIGIGLSHAYRRFAVRRGWLRLDLRPLFGRLVAAIAVTGLIYMILVVAKNYAIHACFNTMTPHPFGRFFLNNSLTLLSTGIRLMAIWILAFHLYHYALLQIRTTEENSRLLLIAKEAEMNNLSSQLNPHFFFNSINTIKALVVDDPDKARRAIDLLAELLRTALCRRDNVLIPIAEELALVSDYLELEKIRFEDRLHFKVHVDRRLNGQQLLPLSIQTLAENAVKHGIAKYPPGGMIHIKVEKTGHNVEIAVRNPGSLMAQESTSGLGLKNLRDRLELQYAGLASVTLRQLPGDTVSAVLVFPFHETN